MPSPAFNVINGGSHADIRLACQEFTILPVGANTFRKSLKIGANNYHTLSTVNKYGQYACNIGDEGGFAPNVQVNEDALDILMVAIVQSGHNDKVKHATEDAAFECYDKDSSKYDLDFKCKGDSGCDASKMLTADELTHVYRKWIAACPIVQSGHKGKVKNATGDAAFEFYDEGSNKHDLCFKNKGDSGYDASVRCSPQMNEQMFTKRGLQRTQSCSRGTRRTYKLQPTL